MTLVSVNFCGGEVLSIYRQVVILRNFPLIVESNLEKHWFCFTSPCGKPQNSRHPLNQSDAKKPNASPSLAFYRPLGSLSSHCLLVMAFSSLIGCCNYFRFCLTLNRNPLWTNSFESFRQQNWLTFSIVSLALPQKNSANLLYGKSSAVATWVVDFAFFHPETKDTGLFLALGKQDKRMRPVK